MTGNKARVLKASADLAIPAALTLSLIASFQGSIAVDNGGEIITLLDSFTEPQ